MFVVLSVQVFQQWVGAWSTSWTRRCWQWRRRSDRWRVRHLPR